MLRFGSLAVGIQGDELDRGFGAYAGRVEGAEHTGTLVTGAEEEWQQAVGGGVDEQHAFSARGEGAAQRGDQAGLPYAAGERKDGERGNTGGRGNGSRFSRGGLGIEDAFEGVPAVGDMIAGADEGVVDGGGIGTLPWIATRSRTRHL